MNHRTLALLIGGLSSLSLVVTVLIPYAIVPPPGTDVYYGATPVGPVLVAGLGVVVLALFGVALAELSPPTFVAGAALILAVVMAASSVVWAEIVPPSLVMELGREDVLAYHRVLVVGLSMATLAGTAWYAAETFTTG